MAVLGIILLANSCTFLGGEKKANRIDFNILTFSNLPTRESFHFLNFVILKKRYYEARNDEYSVLYY